MAAASPIWKRCPICSSICSNHCVYPASLDPYQHLLTAQRGIKLLRFLLVHQLQMPYLAAVRLHHRDLLKPRMEIASYNHHDVGSFLRARSLHTPKIYPLDRANVVMKSSVVKDLRLLLRTAPRRYFRIGHHPGFIDDNGETKSV